MNRRLRALAAVQAPTLAGPSLASYLVPGLPGVLAYMDSPTQEAKACWAAIHAGWQRLETAWGKSHPAVFASPQYLKWAASKNERERGEFDWSQVQALAMDLGVAEKSAIADGWKATPTQIVACPHPEDATRGPRDAQEIADKVNAIPWWMKPEFLVAAAAAVATIVIVGPTMLGGAVLLSSRR